MTFVVFLYSTRLSRLLKVSKEDPQCGSTSLEPYELMWKIWCFYEILHNAYDILA